MVIERLSLTGFRNFSPQDFGLSDRLNVFIGVNGSGKTSLIESIYLLGYGRSFRTSRLSSLVKANESAFTVFVSGSHSSGTLKAGISKSRGTPFQFQVNGNKTNKLSEFVRLFPIQIFTPQSTDDVLSSPSHRRKFIDWGVFHVEQSFAKLSRQYKHVLSQRNALLKQSSQLSTQFVTWDKQIVELGLTIDESRINYLKALSPVFNRLLTKLLPEIKIELEYTSGWSKGLDFATALKDKALNDLVYGNTSVGPHKANLRFLVDKKDAIEVLSRGQLRTLVACLQLAQSKLYTSKINQQCIFLLDDLGAELDKVKRELLLDELYESAGQVVVTAIELSQIEFIKKYKNMKMFHVEHGNVKEE